jgi:hypothetical protein
MEQNHHNESKWTSSSTTNMYSRQQQQQGTHSATTVLLYTAQGTVTDLSFRPAVELAGTPSTFWSHGMSLWPSR